MPTKERNLERPAPNVTPDDDPRASPLGRGADPGPAGEAPPVSAATAGSPVKGANVPGEKGGPEGFAHRENEDAGSLARDGRG